jgi:hypothetical protein
MLRHACRGFVWMPALKKINIVNKKLKIVLSLTFITLILIVIADWLIASEPNSPIPPVVMVIGFTTIALGTGWYVVLLLSRGKRE